MDELKPLNNNGIDEIQEVSLPSPRSRRVAWPVIAVALIILGICLFAAGWFSGSRGGQIYFERGIRVETNAPEDQGLGGGEFRFDNINSVAINTASRNVHFIPTSQTYVRVVIPAGVRQDITEANGVLTINGRTNLSTSGNNARWRRVQFLGFGGNRGITWNRFSDDYTSNVFMDFNFDFSRSPFSGGAIRIYVPGSMYNIYARSTTGNIRIGDIDTEHLHAQATTGRVSVDGGTHTNSHLQTTTGSINAEAYFGNLIAQATTGRVRIQDYTLHRSAGTGGIEIRTTTGSIHFGTHAPADDFRYNVSVTTGSMRVDDNRISGRNTAGGSGGTLVNLSATTGSVRLNFSQN